jgi:hypothetical protein
MATGCGGGKTDNAGAQSPSQSMAGTTQQPTGSGGADTCLEWDANGRCIRGPGSPDISISSGSIDISKVYGDFEDPDPKTLKTKIDVKGREFWHVAISQKDEFACVNVTVDFCLVRLKLGGEIVLQTDKKDKNVTFQFSEDGTVVVKAPTDEDFDKVGKKWKLGKDITSITIDDVTIHGGKKPGSGSILPLKKPEIRLVLGPLTAR